MRGTVFPLKTRVKLLSRWNRVPRDQIKLVNGTEFPVCPRTILKVLVEETGFHVHVYLKVRLMVLLNGTGFPVCLRTI